MNTDAVLVEEDKIAERRATFENAGTMRDCVRGCVRGWITYQRPKGREAEVHDLFEGSDDRKGGGTAIWF